MLDFQNMRTHDACMFLEKFAMLKSKDDGFFYSYSIEKDVYNNTRKMP